jgi:hypothetical protein
MKIILIIVLANQILTMAFALLASQHHPDIAPGLTILFSFGLCALLSMWIRSDAKHAWIDACDGGFLSSEDVRSGRTVWIRADCPRRWLVILHIELAGGFATSAAETERAMQTGRDD